MTNWKTIEVGSGKSKSSATESEDSLNDDVLDIEEDNQEEETDYEVDSEDTLDSEQEELVEEDVLDEELDQDDSEEEEKPVQKKKESSRSETRIRELVAEKKAFETRAREAEERAAELERRSVASEKQNIDSEISSVSATLERVKQDLKLAVEAGDTDALIKGQEALSENKVKLMALQSAKTNFETEQKKTPPKKQAQEGTSSSQNIPQAALSWAEKNDGWFNKNPRLTGTALGVNQELLQEGFNPESSSFYAELDKRLAPFLPKETTSPKSKQEALNPKKSTQVVGSSSKTVPPKSVKVTPQDQERARRLGIDPKAYLRQKAAYERNKENEVSTFKPIFINKDKK